MSRIRTRGNTNLPDTMRIVGVEYVRLADIAGIARWGERGGRSIVFSVGPTGPHGEWEWHVSIHSTAALGSPSRASLTAAVDALIGRGTAFEVEPHGNPYSLHAYQTRRMDA